MALTLNQLNLILAALKDVELAEAGFKLALRRRLEGQRFNDEGGLVDMAVLELEDFENRMRTRLAAWKLQLSQVTIPL